MFAWMLSDNGGRIMNIQIAENIAYPWPGARRTYLYIYYFII